MLRTGLGMFFLVALFAGATLIAADAAQKTKPSGPPLDPTGRPDERLMKQSARYYVWHDGDGWHLRSAARGHTEFRGRIRTIGGQIRKCRTAGYETKGKHRDMMALDKDRQEIQFLIFTERSFDGLDFTVDGKTTELEFELLVSGKEQPKRVFVGEKAQHPSEAKFRLLASPDRSTGE